VSRETKGKISGIAKMGPRAVAEFMEMKTSGAEGSDLDFRLGFMKIEG
jgi:hypothetical protein